MNEPQQEPKFTAPKLPAKFTDFAKVVAAAATVQGIKAFTLSMKPHWGDDGPDDRIHGEVKIQFTSTDGRGRPSRKLHITLESSHTTTIENEPDSFN